MARAQVLKITENDEMPEFDHASWFQREQEELWMMTQHGEVVALIRSGDNLRVEIEAVNAMTLAVQRANIVLTPQEVKLLRAALFSPSA